MGFVVLSLGLVLVVEGLAFALAPGRVEDLLATLTRIPVGMRRFIGLGALGIGVTLVALAKGMGL